jgi:hypothetical protein
MDSYSKWLDKAAHFLPRLLLGLGLFILILLIIFLVLKVYRIWQSLHQKTVFIELTPPAANDKSASATQQLFTVLHGMGGSGSALSKLLRPPLVLSLEIISSRAEGIRYLLRIPRDKASGIEAVITSYLPEVKVGRAADYIPSPGLAAVRVVSFRQKAHFAYPLRSHEALDLQDPLAYLTGAMTKLKSGELVALQLLVKPVRVKEAEDLAQMVQRNEDIELYLKQPKFGGFSTILKTINNLLFSLTDTVTYAYHGQSGRGYSVAQKDNFQKTQAAMRLRPARILSPFEQQLFEDVHQKLNQPLFRADIRALVIADSPKEAKRRISDTQAALASFSMPKYQSLRARGRKISRRYRNYEFSHRLSSVLDTHSNLLSASELSSLYHFPNRQTTKTENLIKSLSRTLPAPVSLKNGQKLDVLLGVNHHHGSETAIGLSEAERDRHIYIIGGTGNGKTTMLLYAIYQDIKAGKGLAVLDPHGDLAEAVLRHIPKDRIKDVIFMNPDDLTHPIGVNLLELPEGVTGDELLREKDLVTESTISVMRKIFSEDDTGGHRIEYVLRNAIQTALTLENPTLFTIFELLNDTKYRKQVVAKLEDKDLKNFWRNELGKAGEFQRVKMAAGITAKIGRFLFSASAKRVLEQPKSTINFEEIMDSRKILICNFSKGLIGEDTSTLFGTTILAKLQMASLRRARLSQADRRPFYLYVDEFQNFATMSFVQMLSEARKYKMFLTMAEQSTTQQQYQRLVEVILANVGTIICFRSGSPADERLILPLFRPFIDEGEIANLPTFNFYMRIAALQAQEPLSGQTLLLGDDGSVETASKVKENSRHMYAIEYREPEEKQEAKAETPKTKKSEVKSTGSLVSAKRSA